MRNLSVLAEMRGGTEPKPGVEASGSASHAILRDCFELFHAATTGLAKLSIDTSNDLFEMDSRVTLEEVYEFRSKRSEWVNAFDTVLRESFEKRLAGQRRKGRRPDPLQSFDALRVMSDQDTSSQNALHMAVSRLAAAAKPGLEALDHRVSVLLDEPPRKAVDNPFSPDYLLDAIGVTSRSIYVDARIWRPLMLRVVGDFVPAINRMYIQINRYLAECRVLPEIGATLRARSDLRPADDRQLLPLFNRLINGVDPSMRAWRTPDRVAANAAGYELTPFDLNPYEPAAANVPRRATAVIPGALPRLDAMMVSGELSVVLEALDHWQRVDPMAEHLPMRAPAEDASGITPLNRIPWIHAAIGSWVRREEERAAIDVVGLLFDYLFKDASLPPRFRAILGGLQVPILKAALAEPSFFVEQNHPARRLIDELAGAAIGTDDDQAYSQALEEVAKSIVNTICAEFVLDTSVLERACDILKAFTDDWKRRSALAIRRPVRAALTDEWHDGARSRVRALIRDKLAGVDVPSDVRGFIGTVWSEYMTLLRQARGINSNDYLDAVRTLVDLLWSIAVKEHKGQKVRLSKMIPPLVQSLRAGGSAVRTTQQKMERFLKALYDLHITAIKPAGTRIPSVPRYVVPSLLANKPIGNLHDFVFDLVLGTWLAFEQHGILVHLRLSWSSPWRATYIFASPSGSTVMVFTPEELAWEMSIGKVTLVMEPVPLFDRAVSVTLEYLAARSAERIAGAPETRATLAHSACR